MTLIEVLSMIDIMNTIQSTEAKQNLGRVLRDAEQNRPTTITRYLEPVAVVVSPLWYEEAKAVLLSTLGSLADNVGKAEIADAASEGGSA